ncbi:MAG: NUDIX domain-containing protein [Chloroflexota bacterium]|nr:NUDIX domain-containing protein [Chloroflexota bacterium]
MTSLTTSLTTSRDRLLVFSHPLSPEAGIQVPAGTVRDNETPEDAVLREAREETGLTALTLVGLLGRQRFDVGPFGRDEIHERWFFHLTCDDETSDQWRHGEHDPSDAPGEVIPFDLFWADHPNGVPSLIADHDRFLPDLIKRLGLETVQPT